MLSEGCARQSQYCREKMLQVRGILRWASNSSIWLWGLSSEHVLEIAERIAPIALGGQHETHDGNAPVQRISRRNVHQNTAVEAS
jgi:hypothetical protein